MSTKTIAAFFTRYGIPQVGLIPSISIWELTTGGNTLVVNNAPMQEIDGGFYTYDYSNYDYTKRYLFRADGGITLSQTERFCVAANESFQDDVQNAVWNETLTNHVSTNTTGLVLAQVNANVSNTYLDVIQTTQIVETLLRYESNRTKIDKTAKTLTIYDNDGVSPLKVFLLKDSVGMPSVNEITERIPL